MPPPFVIRPPSPSSPPLSHDTFDPQPIIRPFPPNYPQPIPSGLHRTPGSEMAGISGVRPAQRRDSSSFSSHFALVTPQASGTPPDVLPRAQANIKDCPHRGDLLGYRPLPRHSSASHNTDEMELDPPAPEPSLGNPPGTSSSARTIAPHGISGPAASMLDDLAPYPVPGSGPPDVNTAVRLPQRRVAALPFRSRVEARPASSFDNQHDSRHDTDPHQPYPVYPLTPSPPQANAGPLRSLDAGQGDREPSVANQSPLLRAPSRATAAPIPIPPLPQRGPEAGGNAATHSGTALNRRYANYLNEPTDEFDIFNPYTFSWGRQDSLVPSVPPPRPSRNTDRVADHDRIDFSPQGLGRRNRTEADWPADLNRPPVDHRTHSQQHLDRLERLDALRTRTEAYDSAFRFRPWVDSSDGSAPSHATLTTSRQSRYPLDEPRDLRSRPGRRVSVEAESSEPAFEIGRWNRNIQEAIGRRMTDGSQSPTSAARRHWEINHPYSRPTPAVSDDISPYPQPSRATGLWGEIPVAQAGDTSSNLSRPTLASGQREPWRPSRTLEFRLRVFDHYQDDTSDHDESFGGSDGQVSPDLRDWRHLQRLQEAANNPYLAFHGVTDPHANPGRPRASDQLLGQMRLTAEMDPAERLRAARSITAGIGRWPMRCRRKAAEQMVQPRLWASIQDTPEMEKDTYCSICHDEYEENSKVSVTPCKHMYHENCLTTWLETPNMSSCPMCRRDLAVLACVTRMVPSRSMEEALPIWMAL